MAAYLLCIEVKGEPNGERMTSTLKRDTVLTSL